MRNPLKSKVLAASLLTAAALLGCGGSQEAVNGPAPDTSSDSDRPRRPGMGVESEIGALDEGKVQQAFQRVSQKLSGCYTSGAQRIAYLSGSVSFKVRVNQEGRARWVFVKDSNLGDRQTEECMMNVLKGVTWPTPEGGEDGLAENGFTFEPGSDERMPVEWSQDQLGQPFQEVKPKLLECRSQAGAGPMKATLYVETDGKPGSIGVSSSDEKGEAAVRCIIDALSGVTFPSPGSFASKVTIPIE